MDTSILRENDLETKNDELRCELEAIAKKRSGLTPRSVLETAKNPRSSLHRYFDWDDTEAARKFRELQAYQLIRRIKVRIIASDRTPVVVRAFFPVKPLSKDGTYDTSKPSSYMSIDTILSNEEATRQLVENAKRELKTFSAKYRTISRVSELESVFVAIDGAVNFS